jgi:hypothetical protein
MLLPVSLFPFLLLVCALRLPPREVSRQLLHISPHKLVAFELRIDFPSRAWRIVALPPNQSFVIIHFGGAVITRATLGPLTSISPLMTFPIWKTPVPVVRLPPIMKFIAREEDTPDDR